MDRTVQIWLEYSSKMDRTVHTCVKLLQLKYGPYGPYMRYMPENNGPYGPYSSCIPENNGPYGPYHILSPGGIFPR